MNKLRDIIKEALEEHIDKSLILKEDVEISDSLKYHIENDLTLTNNVFRVYSEGYFNLVNEVRNLWKEGKIELNETNEEALEREIFEELNIILEIKSFFMTVVHKYPDFELTMHSYLCEVQTKEIVLNEHISLEWLKINELKKLDWAKADIPIVDKLIMNG